MSWTLRIAMVSFILGLIGCNNSSLNKTNIPPQINAKKDLRPVMWWKKMHDPMLDRLIYQALNNNNQILAAQANTMQAQAQLKAAYNAWLPSVHASANVFGVRGWDTHATPQGALAQTPVFTHLDNLKINGGYAGFVPDYSINILENISNTKLARASLEEQKAVYVATRLSIISQTAGAYFNLLGYRQQLAEQRQLIRDLDKLRNFERIRYKDGASDYSALAAVEQQIASNQAHIASIENSITQVQNALQLLTNHDPGPIPTHRALNSLNTNNIIPANLSTSVLRSRPDIMIAYEQLNRADAHLGLSYSRFFPQFSLTGLLGGSSIELVHLLKLTTGLGVAQVAAVMPLFNGVTYQQLQAAKSGVKAAYYNYVHTVRAALVDVDNNLNRYKKAQEVYQNQVQAYQAALRGYRIEQSRYKNGYQDRRGAINTAITADQARINLTLAKMEELNSIVMVYQALAGGYQKKRVADPAMKQ